MKIRVYYEDTDLAGVVYYANYFKFCERARSEKFFEKGILPIDNSCSFVVTDVKAKFLKSAKFADILEIETEVLKIGKVYIVLKQTIFKEDEKIFEMDIKLAYLCNSKPTSIPPKFLEIFR